MCSRRCASACARVRARVCVRRVWVDVCVCSARRCVSNVYPRCRRATVAVHYQNVTTPAVHAIGPHRKPVCVAHSLSIILFFENSPRPHFSFEMPIRANRRAYTCDTHHFIPDELQERKIEREEETPSRFVRHSNRTHERRELSYTERDERRPIVPSLDKRERYFRHRREAKRDSEREREIDG